MITQRLKLTFILIAVLAIAVTIAVVCRSVVAPLPLSQPEPQGRSQPASPSLKSQGQVDFRVIPAKIPMTDGAKLAADIYLPQSGGPFPAILIQTPYDKSRMNPGLTDGMKGSKDQFGFFESSNYAVVVVDWRGKFASKDNLPGKPVVQGGLDGYDCVEWVAKQPWCNGRVGTWGSSALGSIQYETATRKPPHLTAIMPRVAEYGYRYERFYTGGVEHKELIDALGLIGWGALGQAVKAHPLNDGSYETVSVLNPREIITPMLLVGGWYDIHDLTWVFNEFMKKGNIAARKDFRLLIGPFTHEGVAKDDPQGQIVFPDSGEYAREAQRKFFDRWTLGPEIPRKCPG